MSHLRTLWNGNRVGLPFTLLALAALLWIGPGETASGVAAVQGCTQPAERCQYLPLVRKDPNPQVRADSLALYQDMYLGSQAPSLGWTGNVDDCDPGNINESYRAAVLMRLNYYRLMAGVPQLAGLRSEYNQQSQSAAALMSVNKKIDHNADPSNWPRCAQLTGEGVRYSNALGEVNGPEAVDTYMRDDNEPLVALRRYIIFPQTVWMGDGEVPATLTYDAINVVRVIDDNYYAPRPATRNTFVAWPPAAYVPYQVVPAAWSFSYSGADFSQAVVTMKENGLSKSVTRYPPMACPNDPEGCYGESTLVWKAGDWGPWPDPGADKTYTVTVSKVLIGGVLRSFTYNVIVYDPGF
jgi:hypothetical protein